MSDAVADRTLVQASASPPALRLGQGERALVRVRVQNHATVVDQFALLVEGIGSEFFDVRLDQVSLFPGQTGELLLEVHLPSDRLVPAAVQQMTLRVASRHDASVEARVRLPLEIKLVRGIDLDLRPAQVRTRSVGRFRASLTNHGNSELVLDLAVSDPEDALRSTMERDRVAVGPGDAREVEVRLEPRRKPIHGFPTYYRFAITASDVDDRTQDVLSSNGVLVYQPPLGWLGGILGRLRAVTVMILVLLVLAGIMVWILGAPGEPHGSPAQSPLAAPAPAEETPPEAAAPEPSPAGATGTGALGVAAVANPNAAGQVPGAAGAPAPGAASNEATSPSSTGASAGVSPAAPTATPNEQPPVIMRYDVSAPPPDSPPGLIRITWEVQNVTQVTIGGATLPASGSALIQGLQQGEVELVARNSAGETRRSVGVLVLQPPTIVQFAAAPPTSDPGQTVTITWQVARAETSRLFGPDLDPAGVIVDPARGTLDVRPTQTATYTLRAENAFGRVEEALPVAVSTTGASSSAGPTTVPTPGVSAP